MTLTPIETAYKGHRFRSRLEARWAVFLDAAGIAWEYEAEGYNLDGVYYLSDFWLPNDNSFLEIKPSGFWPPGGYVARLGEIAPKLTKLADASGCEVYLIVGSPSPNSDDINHWIDHRPSIIGFAPNEGVCSSRLYECSDCGRVSIRRFAGGPYKARCPCRPGVISDDAKYTPFYWSPRIERAMQQARRARFEHGENG
jgi:hypothetical protein